MPLSLAFEGFEKQLGGSEATGWDRKKIVAVRSFVGWLGKFKPLEAVTITRLSAYVDFRMESVVPQTVHRDLSALSTFFQWTVRKGWIVRNPVRDVQRPKAIPQKRFGLPAEEVRRVLVAVEGTILEPVFKLAFFQGLRRSEIVAAHFEDVNLELGTFYVRGGKTPESAATLPLHPEMARYVSANGLEVASNGQFIGPIVRKRRIRAGEAACYSPCSLENYRKEMNAAGARLPNFHLARHTLGTLLVEKGVDIYRVSRLLRHSSVRTTERYYVHLRPAIAREDLAQFLA
ncbi:MAG: site-specific integrase [Planctomycetota bacterium]